MKNVLTRLSALACATAALSAMLSGCGSGGDSGDNLVVAGDVAIAYTKRSNTLSMNPTDGAPFAAGGDLLIRDVSSGSANERNVTQAITKGTGDVSDPEASYDGKKIVFAMRCPVANNPLPASVTGACTGAWNIWEYDMTSGGVAAGTFRQITRGTTVDDVDPAYLPGDGGFVFASNRQTSSKALQGVGVPGAPAEYFAADEYERERVLNLHTSDKDGNNIKQISINQSHDRNPVVRPNGDIMFSRWDHVGGRNHFKVFRVKPDGTDMFVLYGAHSSGNSFLHPRDMDPSGPNAGKLSSSLMPLQRTHEGGALIIVDAANYSEQNTPAKAGVRAEGGQVQATEKEFPTGRGLSRTGRITTPYPLWDGTNRILVASTPCLVTESGVTRLCDQFTNAQLAHLTSMADTPAAVAAAASQPIQNNARPAYGIAMYDPAKDNYLPVAGPPPGFILTDPIALQKRKEPNTIPSSTPNATLAAAGQGILEVRSVYDTDGLGRMGAAVMTSYDRLNGCTNPIPTMPPTDVEDTRAAVADLVKMKSPADAAYKCAPARFIRVMRAVAPPTGMMGMREAIGETDFEPQRILGYAPIEPDGSFKIKVPADTPIGLAVIDDKGRAFQTHSNWIQVRPGETRTCDGCHSPRRGASINATVVASNLPPELNPTLRALGVSGDTMASRRALNDPTTLDLRADVVFADVWATNDSQKRAPFSLAYAAGLTTTAPVNGVINYPDHIQPLWTKACVGCHNSSATTTPLDLSGTVAGTGRLQSYEQLMLGDPVLDANGLPVINIEDDEPVIERLPARVFNMASEGRAMGLARSSRLVEVLSGDTLSVGAQERTLYASPSTAHTGLLNAAEMRLVAEWIDLGGQYYNNVFASGVAQVARLTEASFAPVHTILMANCAASCHNAVGSAERPAGNAANFVRNRYVLTGSPEGDFNVTLSMISNVCSPANNRLLARPSSTTTGHPVAVGGGAVLPAGSANYTTIANWISTGVSGGVTCP